MILPIPLLLFFAIAEALQRGRFKSAGVRPLIAVLDERAASIPVRGAELPDVTTSLKELAALRTSGALSDDEFEQAKARILGPQR